MGRTAWNKGLTYSEETKKNIVESNKNRHIKKQNLGTGLSEHN